MLTIKKLAVSVDDKSILKGVDLTVAPGEVHAIMGPNGSGKSTLAYVLAGHPKYLIEKGEVVLDKVRLNEATPDARSQQGLFLATQYPVAIPGLTVQSFLWQIYKKHNKDSELMTIVEFREWLAKQAKLLDLNPELLKRSLNDGFSGGEKKKMEIIQLLLSNPKYIILDEIDSGLDVDALEKIAKTVAKAAKDRKIGVIAITHYQRILKYLKPDRVHVMTDGKIIESGDEGLALKIETKGYQKQK